MTSQIFKNRYALQKQLSKNAGRRTFLARDLKIQQLVVIKFLIFAADFEWEYLKLFEREAQALQMLSHPAIPRYLDYFDVNTSKGKGFALVQSYIPAKSLEQWLKSGRSFSEAEVIQLAEALLEILRYLHQQQPQVIHRDIKPSNILLENPSGNSIGPIYLVDFGSVQTLAAQKGSTITIVGTYGYMSPEQFGGRTVPASDLYSLGATLIYVVTGRHPAELSQDNLRIQFESAVNLSPWLIDWLKRMSEPSLNRRFPSAVEALKVLKKSPSKKGMTVRKPQIFGSKIQLKINEKTVEIIIPPAKLSLETGMIILKSGMWIMMLMGVIFLLIASVIIYGGIELSRTITPPFLALITHFFPLLIFGTVWGLIGLFLIYGSGIPALFFRTVRVHLNQQKLSWSYEWPWCKCYSDPILKQNINQLVYQPGYLKTSRNKKGKTNTRFIPAKVIIRIGKQEDEFSVSHLSDPEVNWITDELNTWLGVSQSSG